MTLNYTALLGVDNYVQDPGNSQNYNGYGYVYNNPLKFTDPSGEVALFVPVLVGAVVGILSNGIANSMNNQPFFKGAIKSGIVGAISGAVSFGIGNAISATLPNILAHAYSGGFMSAYSGGNFMSGFVAGGAGAGIASGIGASGISNYYTKSAAMIGGGTLMGGVSSAMAGGSFWKGARQGFITSALNHVAHMAFSNPVKKLTPEQQQELLKIKKNTKITSEFLKYTRLDSVIDSWIDNTKLGNHLKVGVVDYISMGGEVYYDYKLYSYKGINKYEFQFRFSTNLGKGFVAGHFAGIAGAAVGAKYGTAVGGLVGGIVGTGLGWYIDNTYIRGIRWLNSYLNNFGNNLKNQVIFNASNYK